MKIPGIQKLPHSTYDILSYGMVLLAIIPVFLFNPGIVVGETVNSRLATVYALVHHGTWQIDYPPEGTPNPFERLTVDKVQTPSGKLISSKPPLLPLIMAGEYVLMRYFFNWDLSNQHDLRPILQLMIFTLTKIPYVIGVVFLLLLVRLLYPSNKRVLLVLPLSAYAAPIVGFALQLNNHTPAAAAMCGVLYFGLGMYCRKLTPSPWRCVAFGFLSAFVFVTDIPMAIFPVSLGLLLLLRHPKHFLLWAGVGAAPLLLLHFSLMAFITGSPLPVQTREAMYNFRNSYWRNPMGVDGLNENRIIYLFHMTFGRFGTFLLFPILIYAIPGLILSLYHKDDLGYEVVCLAGAFCILTVYYVFNTNNYGGAAYGFRWHIGAVPVLLVLALPAIARIRGAWGWLIFSVTVVISGYSAWECVHAPWGASHEWTCRLIFGPVY